MEFPKEDLQDLIRFCDVDGLELIKDEITDTSRWSVHHTMIFKHNGKYYLAGYSEGATEIQDESPFEYEPDMIECPEVEPVEVTVTEYRVKD